MRGNSTQTLLHAPSVHVGGGWVLLKELLLMPDVHYQMLQLDERVKGRINMPRNAATYFVRPTFRSRLMAEWRLWRTAKSSDVVLCFHGLPPLFPLSARVVIFVQNRLLIEKHDLSIYPVRVRIRINIERLWARVLQRRCSRYVVQTPSMAKSIKQWLRHDCSVSVIGFAPPIKHEQPQKWVSLDDHFDFVYVASGEPHKNHRKLIEAWCILAQENYRPSLALTLEDVVYKELMEYIKQKKEQFGLNVINLGLLTDSDIIALYGSSGALIYPSISESFGLPLLEAAQLGLSIVASELDYVREVVEPVETFDPTSAISIVRAIKRFNGIKTTPFRASSIDEFLAEVQR